MSHLLSIEAVDASDIEAILRGAREIKPIRSQRVGEYPLAHQTWALIFSKASTRTRVSFEVGIRELGGTSMFLSAHEIQLGRGEPIKDTARVLGRMIHGAVIRTYDQAEVEEFAHYAGVPTINALTDEEHPCQILADLFTLEEKQGAIGGTCVTFVGDGACNVARSWLFAAIRLGFELRIAAPKVFFPSEALLSRVRNEASTWEANDEEITARFASGGRLWCTTSAEAAAAGSNVLYTDVWVSMGKEAESEERLRALAGYQINAKLLAQAAPNALVMHCLPAYRGKEIDDATFETHSKTIFDQAENRLHAQKALLIWLAGNRSGL